MSLYNNADNTSKNLFNSISNFNFNTRNLPIDSSTNKNIILKVNPNIKSSRINFHGIIIKDRGIDCQFLTLNALQDFSSLSLEELRYNDYSLNHPNIDNINSKVNNSIILNNDDRNNLFISRNNNNCDINNRNDVFGFINNEEIDEDNKDGIISNENFKIEMYDNNNTKNNQNSLILLNNMSNNLNYERLSYPENYFNKISNMSENKMSIINSYNPNTISYENKNNYDGEKNIKESINLMNSLQPKEFNNQKGNNDAPFLNNDLYDNSNKINEVNDNVNNEQNYNSDSSINMNMNNDKNSLVINIDKNKKNKINIEINDNKINIKINKDINIDINSNNNSLSINSNSIIINNNKNSISINTNNNFLAHKSNFQSINVVNSRKNDINNNCKNIINNEGQNKLNNIFSFIDEDENYIEEDEQVHHSSENKILFERPNSYDKNIIMKMNSLESNLKMNSFEKSSEIIKVNFYLKEPYNLSFQLNVKKNISIIELKKKICQWLIQLNKECISLDDNSFFLMKNYNFINEFGRIDESNICDGDDIYIILKENIKNCQNEK